MVFKPLKTCQTWPLETKQNTTAPRDSSETGTLSGDLLLCAESGCTSTQSVSVGPPDVWNENGGCPLMGKPGIPMEKWSLNHWNPLENYRKMWVSYGIAD